METVEDVYNALCAQGYEPEWLTSRKEAAVLYFSHKRKQYKVYFDESFVEISQLHHLFREEFWYSIGTRRYENPEDTVADVYDTVAWCLEEYGGGKKGTDGTHDGKHRDSQKQGDKLER